MGKDEETPVIGRPGDKVMRFQILLLTICDEYVKYDYHIIQGD
jgi:hypothetical protein